MAAAQRRLEKWIQTKNIVGSTIGGRGSGAAPLGKVDSRQKYYTKGIHKNIYNFV
jgi:hypothetical protein